MVRVIPVILAEIFLDASIQIQIQPKSHYQSQKEAKVTSSIEKASTAADASFAEKTGNGIPSEANMD